MSTFEKQASQYIRALRGGDRENAYHRLIELGPGVIPLLATSFRSETDVSIRSSLVKIAWNVNSPNAIPLLEEALNTSEPDVWKEALDGLVSLGGGTALDVVRRAGVQAGGHGNKRKWLDEATRHISESLSQHGT